MSERLGLRRSPICHGPPRILADVVIDLVDLPQYRPGSVWSHTAHVPSWDWIQASSRSAIRQQGRYRRPIRTVEAPPDVAPGRGSSATALGGPTHPNTLLGPL